MKSTLFKDFFSIRQFLILLNSGYNQQFFKGKLNIRTFKPVVLNLFLLAAHFETFSKFAVHLDHISQFSTLENRVAILAFLRPNLRHFAFFRELELEL